MEFDNVKKALNWYITRLDEDYSKLKALHIGLDCGIDISTNSDGFDDIDTFCDIDKTIKKSLSNFEINLIITHTKYGKDDILINGETVKGGCSFFRRKIKKETTEQWYYKFIDSIMKHIEKELKKIGYIK